MAITCEAAVRLSAFVEYFGRSFFRMASEGCVYSTPFCANVIASSNPSCGVLVFKLVIHFFMKPTSLLLITYANDIEWVQKRYIYIGRCGGGMYGITVCRRL